MKEKNYRIDINKMEPEDFHVLGKLIQSGVLREVRIEEKIEPVNTMISYRSKRHRFTYTDGQLKEKVNEILKNGMKPISTIHKELYGHSGAKFDKLKKKLTKMGFVIEKKGKRFIYFSLENSIDEPKRMGNYDKQKNRMDFINSRAASMMRLDNRLNYNQARRRAAMEWKDSKVQRIEKVEIKGELPKLKTVGDDFQRGAITMLKSCAQYHYPLTFENSAYPLGYNNEEQWKEFCAEVMAKNSEITKALELDHNFKIESNYGNTRIVY